VYGRVRPHFHVPALDPCRPFQRPVRACYAAGLSDPPRRNRRKAPGRGTPALGRDHYRKRR
jgi:hypothetical protein